MRDPVKSLLLWAGAIAIGGCAMQVDGEPTGAQEAVQGTAEASLAAPYQRYSFPYTDAAGVKQTRRKLVPSSDYVCAFAALGGPFIAARLVNIYINASNGYWYMQDTAAAGSTLVAPTSVVCYRKDAFYHGLCSGTCDSFTEEFEVQGPPTKEITTTSAKYATILTLVQGKLTATYHAVGAFQTTDYQRSLLDVDTDSSTTLSARAIGYDPPGSTYDVWLRESFVWGIAGSKAGNFDVIEDDTLMPASKAMCYLAGIAGIMTSSVDSASFYIASDGRWHLKTTAVNGYVEAHGYCINLDDR